jgi:hypothetical protein
LYIVAAAHKTMACCGTLAHYLTGNGLTRAMDGHPAAAQANNKGSDFEYQP